MILLNIDGEELALRIIHEYAITETCDLIYEV